MLGCDRDFPGRNRVVFFCFSIATRAPTMSRQCFGFLSRQRFSRRDREGRGKRSRLREELGQGQEFDVAIECFCVMIELDRLGFFRRDRVWPNREVLCYDKEILCRDIVCQVGKIFYRDKVFLSCDRVGQAKSFLSRHNILMSR